MAAAYKPFPVISIEGDAHACGVQHGQQAAERVARTIDFYLGVFGAQSRLSLAGRAGTGAASSPRSRRSIPTLSLS